MKLVCNLRSDAFKTKYYPEATYMRRSSKQRVKKDTLASLRGYFILKQVPDGMPA